MSKVCKRCQKVLPDNAPFEEKNGNFYCGDCAFIEGIISGKELKDRHYYFIGFETFQKHYNPIVENDKVIFVTNTELKKINRKRANG